MSMFIKSAVLSLLMLTIYPGLYAQSTSSLGKMLGAFLTYLISNPDKTVWTTNKMDELLKQPLADNTQLKDYVPVVHVRKFNAFGEYLFGCQNTLALPLLNTIVINKRTIKEMTDGEQRFVLGRTLNTLKRGKEYVVYKYLLPLLWKIYFSTSETDDEINALKRIHPLARFDKHFYEELYPYLNRAGSIRSGVPAPFPANSTAAAQRYPTLQRYKHQFQEDVEKVWKKALLHLFARLQIAHTSRSFELELDTETAKLFNCSIGAKKALKHAASCPPNDESVVGTVASKVPLFELLYYLSTRAFVPMTPYLNTKLRQGLETNEMPRYDWVTEFKKYAPGQLSPHSNACAQAWWNLPIVKYFSHYPTTQERIKAVTPQ